MTFCFVVGCGEEPSKVSAPAEAASSPQPTTERARKAAEAEKKIPRRGNLD